MIHRRIRNILLAALVCIPLVHASGQTRFALPQTPPDYTSYRYLDECTVAASRVKELTEAAAAVWRDTMPWDSFQLHRPLPGNVVEMMNFCLAKVNVDTIPLARANEVASALLIANRDADAERMLMRLLDSVPKDSMQPYLTHMFVTYMHATPVRYQKLIEVYDLALSRIPADSVGVHFWLRTTLGSVAARSGDMPRALKIREQILAITDTLSEKYKGVAYHMIATDMLFPFVASLMPQDAVDSLSVSTEAYRNYLAGIWKRIVGREATADMAFGAIAPEPKGHFWYSNTGPDGQIKAITPSSVLEKGKVTMIYFLQGGCHGNYRSVKAGRNNGVWSTCWQGIYRTRKIMEQYPNINLVVVSSTFGSIGDAPPLTPQQEADTLASYFLGFHQLKGTQVVYQTDFFRLPNHDNRKVDSETDNHAAYTFGRTRVLGFNQIVLIDERGQIFHYGSHTGYSEALANARLSTVMNRAANRGREH